MTGKTNAGAGGSAEMELLWSGPLIDSYVTKTIDVDMSKYTYIVAAVVGYTSTDPLNYIFLFENSGRIFGNASYGGYSRNYSISSDRKKLTLSKAINNRNETNNTWCIVTEIYGIK